MCVCISGVYAVGCSIYLTGGEVEEHEAVKTVDIYNTKHRQWRSGCELNGARCSHGIVMMLQNIFVMGGCSNGGMMSYQSS